MAKWFKFEEKKPRVGQDLTVWHPRLGRYPARMSYDKKLRFLMYCDPQLRPSILNEVTHWQYAPKGPKEDREKS